MGLLLFSGDQSSNPGPVWCCFLSICAILLLLCAPQMVFQVRHIDHFSFLPLQLVREKITWSSSRSICRRSMIMLVCFTATSNYSVRVFVVACAVCLRALASRASWTRLSPVREVNSSFRKCP